MNSFQLSEGSADVPAAAWVSSLLFPLKDGVAADPNRLEEEVLEGMKEKLDGVGLDPKEARTELSTFWPKLKVMPAVELLSTVVLLLKENRAADGGVEEDEEGEAAGGEGGEAVAGFFSSDAPSVEPAPYWCSMLARWRS